MANHKIEDVEGIGPVTGEKLRAAGVKDTDSLLANCRTPKERKVLAEKSGLTEYQVLKPRASDGRRECEEKTHSSSSY
jgi:hypothetical protein